MSELKRISVEEEIKEAMKKSKKEFSSWRRCFDGWTRSVRPDRICR